jgi:hypothetical protein
VTCINFDDRERASALRMRGEAGTTKEGAASDELRVLFMNRELGVFVLLKGHVQESCLPRLVPALAPNERRLIRDAQPPWTSTPQHCIHDPVLISSWML